jgi:hypothetical protein
MWVAVGIAAVGAVTSIAGGLSGRKAAEEAGEATAANILATEKENQRRRQLDLGQKLGGITAAVHSSNIQMSGSTQRYKQGFESNYRAEMAWDAQKARMDAETAKKGGQLAGQSALYAGAGAALGFASTMATGLGAHANANETGNSPFYFGKGSGIG